ncbi:MAG: Nif3-like dinuclear metal center hexameric protein [Gammaproteobacteria bacterium]|nr:MAG: Nif3-like dinuclear metal center hexameric protein [Gammaproteobacteria bacterium]
MSVSRDELLADLTGMLRPQDFKDYCPNGLQVQGRERIQRLVTGVTACQDLLDAAIAWQADAILVHHGYFWRGEAEPLVGMKYRRIAALIRHDINLLAYHLPLDAHPEYGNNARLGQLLGMREVAALPACDEPLVFGGTPDVPMTLGDLASRIATLTRREPLLVGDPAQAVLRPSWCTGGAQGYIEAAYAAGADVFITGEVSERTVHSARELGVAFIAAGHHATERYGVQAVGECLAQRFDLQHRYIDIDNPA